jgi:signal transduction histidine kinase
LAPAPTTQPRPAHAPREAEAATRLALAEQLLESDQIGECAQAAVDWLGEHGGARWAMCALLDAGGRNLLGLAGFGVQVGQLERFSISLDEDSHPLVFALGSKEPVSFDNAAGQRRRKPISPLGNGNFFAIPLPLNEGREARIGLLLVSPSTPAVDREGRWVAHLLGQKLLRLRALATLAETSRRAKRERELLVKLINSVPDPVLLSDTEGRLILSNARADQLFAAHEGDSEGRHRAVALNNMLFSAALSRRASDEPGAARRELLLVSPIEGSDLLFELLSAVVHEPSEGVGIVSILRNVSDLRSATEQIEENYRLLKLAEADVRAERDRLDLVIDSVADPILVTEPSGRILLMNAPAERLFTVPESLEASAANGEAERAVRANDAQFSSFISNLFFSGQGLRWRGDVSLTDPVTGQPLPVEAVAGKVLSERGEVTAVVSILHDRTEALEKAALYEQLKAASEQLEEKVRAATGELVTRNELLQRQAVQLEQASELKSQFLANMSHELRTPLNAILGYTSMLIAGVSGQLTPPQKNKLTRVDSNAKHLLSIINDILDISRIEAGKMPLHLDEFELPALIGEVLFEVEPLIQKARLTIATELLPGLPELSSDRQKVKQIVLNLLTNAIKFTPQGTVRVTASYDAKARELALAVSDTGIGIAPEDQEKVFEDFRQADNSVTREYGGAGLGLAICRRLAAMLGGRIELRSQLGQGSTFTLFLPRKGKRR